MTELEYAEYLLKNHRVIKKELEILAMDMEHPGVDHTKAKYKQSNIYTVAREGKSIMPAELAAQAAARATMELKKLELAIGLLEKNIQEVIIDLYVYRLNWANVCEKHYISSNTLNRRRKKGISFIAKALECDKLKGLLSEWPEKEE